MFRLLFPCLCHDSSHDECWPQMERSPILHVGFQALDAFQSKAGRLPEPGSQDDAGELLELARGINDSAKDKVRVQEKEQKHVK